MINPFLHFLKCLQQLIWQNPLHRICPSHFYPNIVLFLRLTNCKIWTEIHFLPLSFLRHHCYQGDRVIILVCQQYTLAYLDHSSCELWVQLQMEYVLLQGFPWRGRHFQCCYLQQILKSVPSCIDKNKNRRKPQNKSSSFLSQMPHTHTHTVILISYLALEWDSRKCNYWTVEGTSLFLFMILALFHQTSVMLMHSTNFNRQAN